MSVNVFDLAKGLKPLRYPASLCIIRLLAKCNTAQTAGMIQAQLILEINSPRDVADSIVYLESAGIIRFIPATRG